MEFSEIMEEANIVVNDKGFYDDENEIIGIMQRLYLEGICFTEKHIEYVKTAFRIKDLALVGTEVAEAIQELRKGNIASHDKEIADTTIRIMTYSKHRGIDLENEILEKNNINKNRPRKHDRII